MIPDTQVAPGVPTEHVEWAGNAIAEYQPDFVAVLGDWWDFPSLSSHDAPGSMAKRSANIKDDLEAGNVAFERFCRPWRSAKYKPDCHFFFGNHEDRVTRHINSAPEYDGTITLDNCRTPGFKRHVFLQVVSIDGIVFSHYFYNLKSGRPIGGTIANRMNKIGRSFVAGHEQSLQYGTVDYPGFRRHGLVAGSFYLHDPEYRGPQAKADWRGIVVLNEVRDGEFDVMPLSMNYLKRKFN